MVKIITKQIIKSNFKTDKLFTCSIFRTGSFKNNSDEFRWFRKYGNNFRNLIKIMNKHFPEYKIRVYTDLSLNYNEDGTHYKKGVKLLKELKKNSKVEVYIYHCEDFIKNKYFHDATFGSLVRLFPFFEKNKYNIIWQSDIDLKGWEILHVKKYYKQFMDSDAELYVRSFNCYPKRRVPLKHKFNVVNYEIITKRKYPRELLFDFIDKVKKYNYINLVEFNKQKSWKTKKNNSKMPYGIDEIFTNGPFYDYIMKHKIKVFVMNDIRLNAVMTKFQFIKNFMNNKELLNIIKKLWAQYDYKQNTKSFNELMNFYTKVANELIKQEHKLKKNYPDLDLRYYKKCAQDFLKYKDKVKSPELTYVSFVN